MLRMRLLCFTLLLLGGALCSAQDAPPAATIVSGPEAADAMDSLTSDSAQDATTNATPEAKPRMPTQEEVS